MLSNFTERRTVFRQAIEHFIKECLDSKLEKLPTDSPECTTLIAQHARETWLTSAAQRVAQIQMATHILKPINPDARGTSLFLVPAELPSHQEVGSHILGPGFSKDVVGNAAHLDVFKFLKQQVEERPLLAWMQEGDADMLAALSDDAQKAQEWANAFLGIITPYNATPSSHDLAKQLYWLVGENPADDKHYHLLAPLYASALAHTVHQTINEDRFGEAGKLARQARREHRDHTTGYREYPGLAVQKLGGDNPQNISQLNSERRGKNYLLASGPPKWKTSAVKLPLFIDSIFSRFGKTPEVRKTVQSLRDFLKSDPPTNQVTRNRRDALLDRLIDELIDFAHPLQATLPVGWTRDTNCRLAEAERLWLDPRRADSDDETDSDFRTAWQRMDWPKEIGQRFGNWLNHELGKTLPLGEIEARHWRDELLLHTTWAGVLHNHRVLSEAPTYIPVRGATQ